jgi:hypothetical protein
MKIYKSKLARIINFIKNEGKFKRTDYVKVTINYKNYMGQKAIVTNIDYDKKDYIVGLKFLDGENLDFRIDEIEKLDIVEQYSEDYRKLLNMI